MTTSSSTRPVAVVTGGARGIGEAAVRKFAALGYAVAALDVDRSLGQALADELQSQGAPVQFHFCDVADAAGVDALADRLNHDMGAPSVLVTSAALIPNTDSIMTMDLELHDRMWRVNYHGTVYACRSFGRHMVEARRGGNIVTLGRSTASMPCRCRPTTPPRPPSRA